MKIQKLKSGIWTKAGSQVQTDLSKYARDTIWATLELTVRNQVEDQVWVPVTRTVLVNSQF